MFYLAVSTMSGSGIFTELQLSVQQSKLQKLSRWQQEAFVLIPDLHIQERMRNIININKYLHVQCQSNNCSIPGPMRSGLTVGSLSAANRRSQCHSWQGYVWTSRMEEHVLLCCKPLVQARAHTLGHHSQ